MAEAIVESFWDPALSKPERWRVAPGSAHGFELSQGWCWLAFSWERRPAKGGPALSMRRSCRIDCTGYDRLTLSAVVPEGAILRLSAKTDRGEVLYTSKRVQGARKEHDVGLRGAKQITSIALELDAAHDGPAAGWLNWIGLRNTRLLKRYRRQWDRFDSDWDGYLKPESYEPSFRPAYGILFSARDFAGMRRQHERILREQGTSPFVAQANEAAATPPESMIGDFVNFWNDTRYCRDRDYGNLLVERGPRAAVAGLLLRDRRLLRLAARYAMSIGMCGTWDDGMICRMPGSVFEHRCFVQSLCLHDIALILDLAGDMFTELGRDFLLRRIAEDGMGTVNFNTWRHDYIFGCNQMAWFSPGRMYGYAVLERHMPRVRRYLDIAYDDLVESLDRSILPDGGYVEGPGYFSCVGGRAGQALYYYARARGRTFASVVPDIVKRTGAFGAAVGSTDEGRDVIPICDSSSKLGLDTLAVMASLLPESEWVGLFRKALKREVGVPNSVLAWALSSGIPRRAPEPEPFVFLPDMGLMTSTRRLNRAWVKLLIMGNKANAGHTHEDKGSFVLEFEGETFALDPGTTSYGDPMCGLMKHCQMHNMLVPTGMAERPHPASPLPVDVKPKGAGDVEGFSATMSLRAGWEPYYRQWKRTWESPEPGLLWIRDRYALVRGDAVDFLWHTMLDVTVAGHEIRIQGRRGEATLTVPEDARIRVEDLVLPAGPVHRIVIRRESRTGELAVRVRLAHAQ